MANTNTSIEWTDATWSPVTGCTKVSAGCKNCYAERVFPRTYGNCQRCKHAISAHDVIQNGRGACCLCDCEAFVGRKFTDVRTHPDRLDQPLRWNRPRRIFVNSMSDLFHEDVSFEFIDKTFSVMAAASWHTFQILTKRPARMLQYVDKHRARLSLLSDQWPIPNVWLGVSVEDQKTADERIPILLQTPAAIRFVSYEPALGPVDFKRWLYDNPRLDWVIVGGES
jgi:protein gp37